MEHKAALFTSNQNNWVTPDDFVIGLLNQFNIREFYLDSCATKYNSVGKYYFDKQIDCFKMDWWKEVGQTAQRWIWMNPEYGKSITRFLEKMNEEADKGCSIISLLPARTDTKWFYNYVWSTASYIRFVKGRLTFSNAKHCAPFPSVVSIHTKLGLSIPYITLCDNKGMRIR